MRSVRLAALAIVFVLAGCSATPSRDTPAPGTPAPGTPALGTPAPTAALAPPAAGCAFHHFEDAAAMLDAPMNPKPRTGEEASDDTEITYRSCAWWTADDTSHATVVFREAITVAGAANNKTQFTIQRTPDAIDIPGLGDRAYWDTPHGQILVLVGDDLLFVSTGLKSMWETEDMRSRPDTTKLATLVVSHLGN